MKPRFVREAETAADGESAERRDSGIGRLAPVLLPVTLAGAASLAAAIATLVAARPSLPYVLGAVALVVGAVLAEAFPVPLEALPDGHVSMSAVFIVATAILYGWQAAVVTGFLTRATLEMIERRPWIKLAYNGAVYSLAGAAAGGAALVFSSSRGHYVLFAEVPVAAAAYYLVNIPLVATIVARWARRPVFPLLRQWIGWTLIPSASMASVTLVLAALWRQTPLFAVALVGPLAAIALYQRSTHRALRAMQLALTDGLTGLGNRRHFHERFEAELDAAEREGRSLALCLLDLDDFKGINDVHGHSAGDRVLEDVAGCLRRGGEAFRLGGDEFAIVLPDHDEDAAAGVAETVVARIRRLEWDFAGRVGVSAGVAAYPGSGVARSELYRVADSALYRAKGAGKNQVRQHVPVAVAAVQAAFT
jgi:diguanylate cyclase (GGDEF)-like protein